MTAAMVSSCDSRDDSENTDLWIAIKRALEEKVKGL